MSAASSDVISMAQAEIAAITEAWRGACVERDALRRENTELRALLAQQRVHTQDEATEPEDGGAA